MLSHEEDEDDGDDDVMASYQKYESPKFFVGSGSPVRKQSLQGEEMDGDDLVGEDDGAGNSEGKEAHSRRDRRRLLTASNRE